ncbi:MAG TPA: glycosyltransferase [Methylophaga aminisulfidivorans]|uniref:glycosyltransferase family 2 protein n=1 Tax=Methylophaga TaxID=40222 RepID=UPI001763CB22|nr:MULTISPECIES: glycosyltransferase [Methylophaga]HIC46045.1 glycosyltransferase [Methylophaga sp.]HIM39310.1 glycosyltransferase [Methylophaga aminisulfidivorans]
MKNIGAVVIGRNEGERLKICLESLRKQIRYVVYVDSGSTDSSVEIAKSIGVHVINLDLRIPFTAARARNEGAICIQNHHPQIEFIQFVDGDCEVQSGWLSKALDFLESSDDYAVVCGRRRERYPNASVFNQLCDIEWNTPVGESVSCGGDALIRIKAFQQVNGYRDSLIAGEEPEMCFRMRQNGWRVMRLDAEMTLHDAAMTKVSQWWKRHLRAGHAYAESYFLHGKTTEKFRFKEVRSNIFWSGLLLITLSLSLWKPVFLWCLILFIMQIIRTVLRDQSNNRDLLQSLLVSTSNLLAKIPQTLGLFVFYRNVLTGRKQGLIEYK